jgi:adenylate kinase
MKLTSLIVVMGVSGSGKTVVGKHLAQRLGLEFVDGDDLHSVENVDRMRVFHIGRLRLPPKQILHVLCFGRSLNLPNTSVGIY